jgi:ribosomal 50S subunit-recycling heat shock protein
MPVDHLNVDPSGGAYYGWGYNLTTKQFTGICVNFNPSAKYAVGDPGTGEFYNFVEDTSTIASQSNLSVSASLKVLIGGSYQLDNKTSVTAGTESSSYSLSLLANYFQYDVPQWIDLNFITFKPPVLQLLNTPGGKGQFKQQCGDGFVIGVQEGREFSGTATVTKQNLKSWIDFANETGISVNAGSVEASAKVNVGEKLEQSFGSNNILVKVYSTGSNIASPTSASALKTYYENFKNSQGPKKTIKLTVVPYQLVADYPWENPLQGTSKEDYIGMMVVGLWELKAALRDANFILDPTTVNMFALGSIPQIKQNRVSYIRQLRDMWQREYDMLLRAAQSCNDNFTPQCRQLAEFYDRHRDLKAQWLAAMPERYLSDCYQSIVLTDVTTNLKGLLSTRNFGTPVFADSETAGNPSRVVAKLTYKPDYDQLKADLSITKMEWHLNYQPNLPISPQGKSTNDGSTWGMYVQSTVFDLRDPKRYGVPEVLKHCQWRGKGVNFPDITTPYAMTQLHRFNFAERIAHGYIDGISGRNPRGQVHFGNGRGALNYITCEVDRKGNDNDMYCRDLSVRNVGLLLDSKQDLSANGWRIPSVPVQLPAALTSFSQGQTITAAHLQQFKPLAASLTPSQRTALNKSNAQRAQSISKFQTKSLRLPASQMNIIQQRLKVLPGATKTLPAPIQLQKP